MRQVHLRLRGHVHGHVLFLYLTVELPTRMK
jgi:hypothetical protein